MARVTHQDFASVKYKIVHWSEAGGDCTNGDDGYITICLYQEKLAILPNLPDETTYHGIARLSWRSCEATFKCTYDVSKAALGEYEFMDMDEFMDYQVDGQEPEMRTHSMIDDNGHPLLFIGSTKPPRWTMYAKRCIEEGQVPQLSKSEERVLGLGPGCSRKVETKLAKPEGSWWPRKQWYS